MKTKNNNKSNESVGNERSRTALSVDSVVMLAKVSEKIGLTEFKTSYSNVRFTENIENYTIMYSWSAGSKNSIMNVYPMRDSQNVKFFKTLNGAKRNFLRRLRV
uniref:Uncharacterized protein n=1 Tax=viral metagenome TaxID=1070528 RepID=A0A6H2A5X9_9ZZZZ